MAWHSTGLRAYVAAVTAIPVMIESTAIVLVPWEGGWYAIEDRCSHAGCAFTDDGEIDGFHAICNCHGSEFDVRTGRPLRSPARVPIATFTVRIEDGMIEVEL